VRCIPLSTDAIVASDPFDRFDPFHAFQLDGRVAVVTGASSGLGARFATVLDAAGAQVVMAARRVDRLEGIVAGLTHATAVACDVSQAADLDRLVDTCMSRFGRIDVLVNNAGITSVAPAVDEPVEDFRRLLEVNLVAPFLLSRMVAEQMGRNGGGSIVNIASIVGLVGIGRLPQAAYSSSKGGLVNLTRELAAQWASMNVRVNALAPGWFESEMTAGMFTSERGLAWISRNTPLARPGRSDELDGALLFLTSPASSYVTGAVLPVDGGWTAI
jgi:NAD(P)-dependent dehydrogenase (short-subunit alcohol dehydrogenase family)